ncbi:unnamed protein product [Bemisia tabaci]|uniref:Parathion hydrolase-related protein n=1 Tax=Bemisia tabaci TaxID=7038 RepID=A0A9P0ADI4_BEMTA|nr:PREDICTED: phosphotriesterase-related protein [Bemisia tabaci]CAH0389406.1 unnamed protein product [Bemisia tabaci]
MSVETVLGPIASSKLGKVLTHEHFSIKYDRFNIKAPEVVKSYLDQPISMGNLGFVRQYPYSCPYNVTFNDEDSNVAVMKDVSLFKQFGGGTIVENSCHGLHRDLKLLKKVSLETGVNVIVGTGFYVKYAQSDSTLKMKTEEIHDLIYQEINSGCVDDNTIKCGFIGEVGSSWPISDFEKRVIVATAQVQAALKCPVTFHPDRNPKAPFEIIRIFLEAGGKVDKTVMSHLDRTLHKNEDLLEFAGLKTYCQFDLFGNECSFYQLAPEQDMPSDGQRINKVMALIEEGRGDRILLSHDIHTKHRLVSFGGHGYAHILNNVVPKMKIRGISQEMIDNILMENPKRWLEMPN